MEMDRTLGMNTIDCHNLASQLLRLGARISIIGFETGLSATYLRKAYSEIFHKPPPRGQMKASPNSVFRNFLIAKEATVFAFFYRIEPARNNQVFRSIAAYRRYAAFVASLEAGPPRIDFSTAYQIVKWIDADLLRLVRCGYCRSAKLDIATKSPSLCPVCKRYSGE